MRLFRPELLERAMLMFKVPDDQPIDMRAVSRSIEGAQKQVESQNFEMRKNVLKYDDVMNRQRHAIYGDRRRVLDGADVSEQLRATCAKVVEDVVREHTAGIPEDWDLDTLFTEIKTLFPTSISIDEVEDDLPQQDDLVEMFIEDAATAYDRREEELGADTMRELERQVLLTVLDRKWREHLYEMDYLREGIGLRAMAQRDPLVEYQREGGDMFASMMEAFMEEVVGYLFNLEVKTPEVAPVTEEDGTPVDVLAKTKPLAKGLEGQQAGRLNYSAPDESGEAVKTTRTESTDTAKATGQVPKVGRNKACPCGSGKKYKVCHGRS